jgi:release factor glutamine methyltransferase
MSESAPDSAYSLATGDDLWKWWVEARQRAEAEGISVAEVDWFIQEMTDLDRLSLRLQSFRMKSKVRLRRSLPELSALWRQRIEQRVPVQYLTGTAPWRQFSLEVSPAVLIPRPETELIIDLAFQATIHNPVLTAGHWADLGTGSGAIALGLADVFPQARVHAVDISEAALAIARSNADQCGLSDRIQFYQGAWFAPLDSLQHILSGVVTNPPYIPSAILPELQPEVSRHEPWTALDGGSDGLDCIRYLITDASEYLKPGGIWLTEIMADQADTVIKLLQANGNYQDIQVHTDLAGIERFVLAYRRN